MQSYQAAITKHLGEYARRRLGIFEQGTYKERRYAHILPEQLRLLNFLEAYRAELQQYCLDHKEIKLHRYFHHLNSSQAFTFNLFFPYFRRLGEEARSLGVALGIDSQVLDWSFEHVVDTHEGTNVDVSWRIGDTATVFCEVKLSESEFGSAVAEERHHVKLATIYRPRLESLVSGDLLREQTFFKNYQLLRNVCLLAADPDHRLILLMPRENEALQKPLNTVLPRIAAEIRRRIKVAFIEDCIAALQSDPRLPIELRVYANALAEKYVVPRS